MTAKPQACVHKDPPKNRGVLWPPPPISCSPHTDTIFHCVHLTRPESNEKGLSAAHLLAILLSAWPSSHTHTNVHTLSPFLSNTATALFLSLTLSHTHVRANWGMNVMGGLSVSLGAWQPLHRLRSQSRGHREEPMWPECWWTKAVCCSDSSIEAAGCRAR